MQIDLASWLERSERATLPALTTSIAALLRLMASEETPLPAYAAVIEQDPGLTLALLRHAGSQHPRRLHTEVTTVEHALMLLGLKRVRALLPTLPLVEQIDDDHVRTHLLALYSCANHAAFHAQVWARLRKDIEPDEVQCATLLHGLAEMALWMTAPAEMSQLHDSPGSEQEAADPAAYFVKFGFSREGLAAALAARWGLPRLLRESLLGENAEDPRIVEVVLAVNLVRSAERGWYTAEVTDLLEQLAVHLHGRFDATATLVHRTAVEAARLFPELHGIAGRLLNPLPPEAQLGWTPPSAAARFCRVPQPQLLRRALYDLKRHEEGGMAVKEILQLTIEAIHEGAGLDRVVFASLDHGTLKARHVACAEQELHLCRFEVELREGDLLYQMMRKAQALWVEENNRERYMALLPEEFRRLAGTDAFFLLSIFAEERPLGLFYASRHHDSGTLDATAFHRFKQLGLQAARNLAGAVKKHAE